MVGATLRIRGFLGGLAGIVVLAGCSSGAATPSHAGPAPTGLATRFDDESTPGRDGVSWRTFWALCWDGYAGAGSYEIRTLTGEGASARLIRQHDRCYRIEAAAGVSTPEALARDRAQSLASQQGQLAVQVRAVLGGGRTDWSVPVAVGSTATAG